MKKTNLGPLEKKDWFKNWDEIRPADWFELFIYLRDTYGITEKDVDLLNDMIAGVDHKKIIESRFKIICERIKFRKIQSKKSYTKFDKLRELGIALHKDINED